MPYDGKEDTKSYVTDWLIGPVIEAVRYFGAEASFSGRNDLLIGEKKFSGVSQYIRNGYVCSHGTLIFNIDLDRLERVLTVDGEKIKTKAVASVRSRVTNIADHIEEKDSRRFREKLVECYEQHVARRTQEHIEHKRIGGDTMHRRGFDADELRAIEKIVQQRYENPEWIFGREPAFTYTNKKRFPGGGIEIFLDVKGGVIQSAKITGDFLALEPVTGLEEKLTGVSHTAEALEKALSETGVSAVLGSLSAAELLEVLM